MKRARKTIDHIAEVIPALPPMPQADMQVIFAKAAAYDQISPQLDQLNRLAQGGWLGAITESSPLILVAIGEITMLRQERTAPMLMPDLNAALMTGFAAMWQRLSELLNDPSKGSHQARYEAFVAGINVVGAAISGHARTQSVGEIEAMLASMELGASRRVDAIVQDTAIPDRGHAIALAEIERSTYVRVRNALNEMMQGGYAGQKMPDQPAASGLN